MIFTFKFVGLCIYWEIISSGCHSGGHLVADFIVFNHSWNGHWQKLCDEIGFCEQDKLKELLVQCIPVQTGRKLHIVRYHLTKKLHSIIQCRYSMFERVFAVKPTVAEKLLSYGYKQLSRFGWWCPVKVWRRSLFYLFICVVPEAKKWIYIAC